MSAADFDIGKDGAVALSGDWISVNLGPAPERLERALKGRAARSFELSRLGRMDTAGAYAAQKATGLDAAAVTGRDDVARLMELVAAATAEDKPDRRRHPNPVYAMLVRAGAGVEKVGLDIYHTAAFQGRLMLAIWRLFTSAGAAFVRPLMRLFGRGEPRRRPSTFRAAATVSLMERAGLDALPIVAVTNFFVGATIAFLGATLLAQFGGQVFSVELVGIGVLREFGVLVTAIILAGRSASSFAAELGAMKMNQEVDAMSTMGVDPFDALVIPRFIAMLTMMPLLVFVAMIAGMAGGMCVIWGVLNLSPNFFFQRLLDNVGQNQFWIGIVKAPVMAVVIAAIGCRQGLEVGGDVEQLGRRVTTAVVQSLFSIILLDAVFALIFMELNL